jgi:hypothetical protein
MNVVSDCDCDQKTEGRVSKMKKQCGTCRYAQHPKTGRGNVSKRWVCGYKVKFPSYYFSRFPVRWLVMIKRTDGQNCECWEKKA